MEGKSISYLVFFILVTSITYIHTQSLHRKAYLRGGLIFEKHHDTPIIVNPTTVTLYRQLNTTLLLQSNELLKYYTASYQEFCDRIRNARKKKTTTLMYEFFVLPTNMTYAESKAGCMKQQGKLPEVRTFAETVAIKAFAKSKNIKVFPAGMEFDNIKKVYIFNTERDIVQFSPATIEKLTYYNSTGKKLDELPLYAQDFPKIANENPIYFAYDWKPEGVYYVGGSKEKPEKYPVICARTEMPELPEIENSLLLKLTAHTCLRDANQLNATTRLLQNEINSFMATQHRHERDTKDTDNTCYIDLCLQLYQYFSIIDFHSDNITTNFHFKQYLIYKLSINNHLFQGMSFKFFQTNLENPHAINQYMTSDPRAEIMYQMAKDYTNQAKLANTYYFTISYFDQNQNVIEELDRWVDKDLTPVRFQNNVNRKKRYAAVLGGGIMLANAISSSTSGEAPLSWFGNVLSSTLGLATKSDFNKIIGHLHTYGTALNDLTINQDQLYDSYLQVKENVIKLKDQTVALEYGAANMAIELDNRLAIKHMQFIIQLTLLKIANTFSFATQHKASPYILSQEELDNVALKFQNQRIFLSTNMNDIHVNLFHNNSNFVFTFTIPVLDDRAQFNFYETRNFPIFQNGYVYSTAYDARYFAMTTNTNEYTLLTDTEYSSCINSHICQVSDVVHPIDEDAHCTLRSFQENKAECRMIRVNTDTPPFFAFYDNKTFYSTPEQTPVRIICQDSNNLMTQESQTQMLAGIGQLIIKPACTITLPDNRKYFSNPILQSETLEQANMLDLLKDSQTATFNFTFKLPAVTTASPLPNFTLKKAVNTTLLEQIIQEISEPAKSISVISIFSIIILTIALICILCCMFNPCFRTWFTTCTFLKNPKTWWTQYKSYNVTDFTKTAHSKLLLSRIKAKFRTKPESARQFEPPKQPPKRPRLNSSESSSDSDISMPPPMPNFSMPYRNTLHVPPVGLPVTQPPQRPTYIDAKSPQLYPQVIFADPNHPSNQTHR